MMREQFLFPKISVRSTVDADRKKRVIVKGYAVAPDVPHEYQREVDSTGKVVRTFKSLFTRNFVRSIGAQLAHKPIFVDALHQTAANINIRATLDHIKARASKSGENFDQEVDAIMANLKVSQFPLGKPVDFNIDDNGMFFEIELNPEFRDVDMDHQRYYDAVVGSLQNGVLNGMSINFQATNVITDENGLERIDDGNFYGVSFVPDAALTSHSNITEVAIRSIMEVRNMNTKEETKPVENTEPVQHQTQNSDVDYKAEYDRVQAEIASLKAQQAQEAQKNEFKSMVEDMKRELLESVKTETKPKGVVKTETEPQVQNTIQNKEDFRESLKELSWQELAQLQHETGAIGNEVAKRMGLINKKTDMDFN